MDVNFELTGNVNLLQHLKAEHQNAVINVGKHLQTSLLFSPKGICNLQDVILRIKVTEADSPKCFSFWFYIYWLSHFKCLKKVQYYNLLCNKILRVIKAFFQNDILMITSCKSQVLWQIMLDLITWSVVLRQTYFSLLF